ncbi:MAG: dTDP-glucose 4,6-dehydratase [Chloroflexi bacterium]|nr:dTDP-glucose 4,6-dehydratase [Chloroflexota bacterium]
MKLLVCGGAGFIGSAFVRRRLAATDDTVVVLDKLTYAGNLANLTDVEAEHGPSGRYRFAHGDIADPEVVDELVVGGDTDAVVNFAAESHVDRSILDAEAFLRTGVLGVHVLLEATRRLAEARNGAGRRPRFLQVSTDEVYGSVPEGKALETDPLAPQSPYSAAKAAGELLVQAYRSTHGLDIVMTRGANTYGPRQHPEKLVPLFVTNALQGFQLPLYGDGLQRRDWLHVDDHADAVGIVLDAGEGGGIYNVPGTGERTNLELTETILRLLDQPRSLIRRVEDRPGHDRRYAMDGGQIATLGWQHAVGFDDGLAGTVAWYRDNEAWWHPLLDGDWRAYYDRQYGRRLAESVDA